MKNSTPAKLANAIILIFCTAIVGLRIYQILKITDSATGFLTENDSSVFATYFCTIIGILSIMMLNFFSKRNFVSLENAQNKNIGVFSLTVSIFFFVDFIHQVLNGFDFVEQFDSMEWNVLIPIFVTGIMALISCFYFITLGISNISKNYDFKSFTILHIMPTIWAIGRMLGILIKAVNFRSDIQTIFQIIYLISLISFFSNFALSVDDKSVEISRKIIVSGMTTAFFGLVFSLPRIAIALIGKYSILNTQPSTSVTDFMISLFALYLAHHILKNNKSKE